jgi:hypothetical protein
MHGVVRVLCACAWVTLAACDDSGGGAAGAGAAGTGASGDGAAGVSSAGTGGDGLSGTSGAGASGAGASGAGGTMAGTSAASGAGGSVATGGVMASTGGSGSLGPDPSFEEVEAAVEAYGNAHPGMDGDITQKSEAELAADPAAAELHALCGEDQLPVIPLLTWEYGGADHAWINAEASALVYCVYIPVQPSSEHWAYDAAMDHVTADVSVLFPEDNPCKDEVGADQVAKCIGDPTNFEILVDTASMHDGHDVGLELSESSTDLKLILPSGEKVQLFHGA